MGGRDWSRDELAELGTLNIREFMTKWKRTEKAVIAKRYQYGIKGQDQPASSNGTPLCGYCSGHAGDCTCSEGHRCLDSLCLYAKTNRR